MVKAKATSKTSGEGAIQLVRLPERTVTVQVVGQTPLIPHRWSEKARQMMPGHPLRAELSTKRGARDPEEEAAACLYRLADGRLGMPATAFKAAMVSACRLFEGITMTEAKQFFFVEPDGYDTEGKEGLVEVKGHLQLREDTPRNANGGADLRYRNQIFPWEATLRVRFRERNITPESIVALIDAAGSGGIGDWRPSAPRSATGIYGQWRVASEDDDTA